MSARSRDDLLADMRGLCDEVADATSTMTRQDFIRDIDAIRAMERRLELMGEIAVRLGQATPDADVDWDALRGLRVLLAHVYHKVRPERLWTFAVDDVPRVRAALRSA